MIEIYQPQTVTSTADFEEIRPEQKPVSGKYDNYLPFISKALGIPNIVVAKPLECVLSVNTRHSGVDDKTGKSMPGTLLARLKCPDVYGLGSIDPVRLGDKVTGTGSIKEDLTNINDGNIAESIQISIGLDRGGNETVVTSKGSVTSLSGFENAVKVVTGFNTFVEKDDNLVPDPTEVEKTKAVNKVIFDGFLALLAGLTGVGFLLKKIHSRGRDPRDTYLGKPKKKK